MPATTTKPPREVRPVISIGLRSPEAAAALGISTRKLHSLVADRTSGIPFVKLDGCLVFPVAPLAAWLNSRTVNHTKN